jgi:hypothetical protein
MMHLVSLKPIASSVNASHLPMLVKDEWEKWGNVSRRELNHDFRENFLPCFFALLSGYKVKQR